MKSGSASRSRLDRIAAPLLCIVVLAVFADVVFLGQRLFVRDVASYYYPTKKIVRDTILVGELPLWNRFYGAGQPMAANPEYSVFYPPHLLLLLPGYGWWFQILVVGHVAFGAIGMYRFLRSLRLSGLTAMYGALAFAFGGLSASLLNLLPYLFILSWIPWAFMCGRRWLLSGDRRSLAAAALAFGMQILTAEPTTLVQIWLMVGVWVLFVAGQDEERPPFRALLSRLVAMFVLSIAIGAVQLLPAIDHVGDSVRALRFDFDTVVSWSAPPLRPIELLIPSFFGRPWFAGEGGYWGSIFYAPRPLPFLFSIYCGFPVVVFAIVGFVKGGRMARWIAGGCSVSFILAIGSATPIFGLLYGLGPGQSFRYPEKFLISFLLALLVFALINLDRVAEDRKLVSKIGVSLAVAGLVVSAGALIFLSGSAGVTFSSGVGGATTLPGAAALRDAFRLDWIANIVRFGVFAALFVVLGRRIHIRTWSVALILIGLVDLATGFRAVSPSIDADYFDPPPIAASLDADRDQWRVFPLANWYQSYGLSREGGRFSETGGGTYWTVRNGMAPMLLSAWGFRQVLEIDYDKTALLPTTRLIEALWEIRNQIGDDRDRTLMAMSSAKYFTRFRSFEDEIQRSGTASLAAPVDYLEVKTNPMYWIPERIESIEGKDGFVRRFLESDPGPRTALVESEHFEPGPCAVLKAEERASSARVEVDCTAPSLLVANVTPHKYWTARVDGRASGISTVNLGYTGVRLPEGTHVVELDYDNPVVTAGAVVTAVGLLVMVLLWRKRPSDIR